jgi:putative flavoprotein involved in K+ transport
LGRLQGAQDSRVFLAPTLKESLTRIDNFVDGLKGKIDAYIEKNGIEAPPEPERPPLKDGFEAGLIEELDLRAQGITTIIWATGFQFDYGLVRFPVLDEDGYPRQHRGVTEVPGLYFVGLHFMHRRRSGLPWGIAPDAEYIAGHIEARSQA